MSRPLLVALTGGVASGKSTVARLFEALGVTVLDADAIAREVVAPGSPLLERVVEHFGPELLAEDGSLRRALLRARIFADPEARHWLERLLHPEIERLLWSRAARAPGPYCLVVVPLLVETGQQRHADRVLVVDAPEALQRARLRERDGATGAEADTMLGAQATREARLRVADDVVVNDGGPEGLRGQVEALHRRYLGAAAAVCQAEPK